jgi:hypothetical protein
VRGSNIDINKLKSKVLVQHFLSLFKKNYIVILVLYVVGKCDSGLPLLVPQTLIDQFFKYLGM